jgi:hypothetical protein
MKAALWIAAGAASWFCFAFVFYPPHIIFHGWHAEPSPSTYELAIWLSAAAAGGVLGYLMFLGRRR